MEVIGNIVNGEDPINYLGFEELSDLGAEDIKFFYAGHPHPTVKNPTNKRRIFFSTEEQAWDRDTTDNFIQYVDKILTICPPKYTGRAKRTSVFFPFNEKFIPEKREKEFDVIYCGNAVQPHIQNIVDTISGFNYRYVSFQRNRLVTNHNVTYPQKIDLISKSRVNMVHNLIGNNTPQIKTRPFDGAFCRSLNLCLKDDFNIIEEWFEPDKEFIYFENSEDLKEKLTYILTNYSEYQHIVDNAYEKAVKNYTTKEFILKYLQ